LGLYLRLPELFLDDEEDEREELARFFEVAERLREEADRDDLDFLVAGIFVFLLYRNGSTFLRCTLLTCLLDETRAESVRLAEFASGEGNPLHWPPAKQYP
jgi:hypothetical protein